MKGNIDMTTGKEYVVSVFEKVKAQMAMRFFVVLKKLIHLFLSSTNILNILKKTF